MEKVTLQKPHTHGGVDRKAGDVIEVSEVDRDWLTAQKIIQKPAAPAAKAANTVVTKEDGEK